MVGVCSVHPAVTSNANTTQTRNESFELGKKKGQNNQRYPVDCLTGISGPVNKGREEEEDCRQANRDGSYNTICYVLFTQSTSTLSQFNL